MIKIIDKKDCCGCSACTSICPKHCIEMESDKEGFLYPCVDVSRCVDCGLCEKVCPIRNKKKEECKEQKAYLVQHRDEQIRKESSSGGAFTAIASWVLDKGGVVFGACYDDKFKVYHKYVEQKEDLKIFRNSKYVQSVIGDTFVQTKKFLESERWVCYSGTPCQIEGLKMFLKKEYEKLVLVDVVCHGISSPMIWNKYLEAKNVKKLQIEDIRFRDKYYGYKYSTMSFVKEGKNVYHAGSQMDSMLRAFFTDICDRPSCYDCKFKKRYRLSDITIWDCFSVYNFDKSMDDDKGTTRVLCHTELGKKIIGELDNIVIKEVEPDKLVYGVKEMFKSVEMNSKREKFFFDAEKLNGVDLFDKWCPISMETKLKTSIRTVLLKMGMYRTAKKVLNMIERR